jgi:hypothetical protein
VIGIRTCVSSTAAHLALAFAVVRWQQPRWRLLWLAFLVFTSFLFGLDVYCMNFVARASVRYAIVHVVGFLVHGATCTAVFRMRKTKKKEDMVNDCDIFQFGELSKLDGKAAQGQLMLPMYQ